MGNAFANNGWLNSQLMRRLIRFTDVGAFLYVSGDVSMNKFKLTSENLPIAPLSGNRELMHDMTIHFLWLFCALECSGKEWS